MVREEWVYAIGSPGSHTIKIGRSNDPRRRLSQIQTMSPVLLQLLWTRSGDHEAETYLHRRFGDRRSHGEWFAFTEDPIEALDQAITDFQREADQKASRESLDARGAILLSAVDQAAVEHLQARGELDEAIREAREAGVSLATISEHSGFSREWVRRIAASTSVPRSA